MALAVVISKKVHRLGLIPKLVRLLSTLLALLALSSIAWLLWLPIEGNYRNTYISENALMPAQANSYFRELEWNIVRGYRNEVHNFKNASLSEKSATVESWLQDIGLKTSYHQDTLYAVMHAPRGDHTEAMVVTVPWTTSEGEYNEGGVSVAVALARYFKRLRIWSKNIVFVFPPDGHLSLRLWVEAYHTSLDLTAGSIDAALVIEYGEQGDHFDYYEVAYEGLNGQLPNLDLMNSANLIGYHEQLRYLIQGATFDETRENSYWLRLRTLVRGIVNLALTGLTKPSNGCEAFLGWQIQAITIKARGNSGPPDITQFGRIVDSTLRSVNNLLEKFHQLFFFYLMLSPGYFVSIGTYLPAAVLLSASFVLAALACLFNSGVQLNQFSGEIGSLISGFTGVGIMALVFALLPPYVTSLYASDSAGEARVVSSFLYGFTTLCLALSAASTCNTKFKSYWSISRPLSFLLLALSLFYIAIAIFALLIVHFLLALAIGFLALPLTVVQPLLCGQSIIPSKVEKGQPNEAKKTSESDQPNIHKYKSAFKLALILFVSSPFFSVFLVGQFIVPSSDNIPGVVRLMRGLLTSWNELQCWTWFVLIFGWFHSWLCIALVCVFGDFERIKEKEE